MYSHNPDIILDAFTKAYESALSNYEAASILKEKGYFSQATSIAVLALEEVGKMMMLDGLLFARTGDERYKQYKSGHLSHRMKLDALELFPLFLHYLSTVDPRQNEKRYKQTLVVILTDLKEKRHKLSNLLRNDFVFPDIDSIKQKGFYSHESDVGFIANKDAIAPELSEAILELTWRITDTLKFVLGHSIEKYKNQFYSFREHIDEETLKRVRKESNKIVENIFGLTTGKPEQAH